MPDSARLDRRPWLTSLLFPDLGLIVSAVTLFYCLFLFDGGTRLFRDSDTGWHIRTGEAIVETGRLPMADPYSFSKPGAPWLTWEWGADALMGLAHRTDGLRGVTLLYGAAIALCTWLWFRLHWAVEGNFFLACAMASPMLSTANLHWLARPHVFGWVMLLLSVLFAERRRNGTFGIGTALRVALFTSLWANLHASFFLAPILALIYAVSHLLRILIWDADERRQARWFLLAALSAAAGSLLNPYGLGLHRHLFGYLSNGDLLARIGEFQSFNFHAEGALQILLTIGLAGLGAVLALGQRKIAHFLISAMLIAGALRSARGLPLVALASLPLACGAITESLRLLRGMRPRLRAALDQFLDYSDRVRQLDRGLGGFATVPVILLIAMAGLRVPGVASRIGFPKNEFPVAAAAAVSALPGSARLLAPDKFGGYLIYRFNGSRKVYFDGRSDFYGLDFMKQYIRLMEVRPGWQEQLQAGGFTHALLPNDYSLVAALEQAGWQRIYRDEVATLLRKAQS